MNKTNNSNQTIQTNNTINNTIQNKQTTKQTNKKHSQELQLLIRSVAEPKESLLVLF
jgi:hypothetical protein